MTKQKIKAKIETIKAEIKSAGTPSDMNQLGQYQGWISEKYAEIKALEEKMNAKANKKSLKGDKMSKNNEVLEVTVEDNIIVDDRSPMTILEEKKERASAISETNLKKISSLTDQISVSSQNSETKEALGVFLKMQQEMVEPQGIMENGAKLISKLPYMEKIGTKIYKDIKKTNFNDGTFKETIGKVYDDLMERNLKSQDLVKDYILTRTHIEESYEETIIIRDELNELLVTVKPGTIEYSEIGTFIELLNAQIRDYQEEIEDMSKTEFMTRAVSKRIVETLPTDKDRLYRKLLGLSFMSELKAQNDDMNLLAETSLEVQELTDKAYNEGITSFLQSVDISERIEKKRQERMKKKDAYNQAHKKKLSENMEKLKKNLEIGNAATDRQIENFKKDSFIAIEGK